MLKGNINMRVLSFRDIKLALPHMKNEVEMMQRENDTAVLGVLAAVGFSMNHPVSYEVAYHRDMQGGVAVGIMAVGEYNHDSKYRDFLDTTDRIVVAGMQDASLAREMEEIRGKKFGYRNDEELEFKAKTPVQDARYYSQEQLIEMGYTGGDEEVEYEGTIGDDYEIITSQIAALVDLKKMIRGE